MATDPLLNKLLTEIESELVRLFPEAARAARVVEPVYALILCYIDTTTDDYMPYVVVCPERVRRRAMARKGADASWMIWSPIQNFSDSAPLLKQQYLEGTALQLMIRACYKLLTDASNEDDDVQLRPFREMMWQVARILNDRDWRGVLDTTDDFVVIASDWSSFWAKEDATNSLPPGKRRLLEDRRLFYHEPTEQERAEFQQQLGAVEAKLASQTERQRIAFWIHELAHLAAGEDCLLARRRWNESVALGRLAAVGQSASLPLLDLAARLDTMPDNIDGLRSTASEVLEAVLSTVGEVGRADTKVEARLRALLAASCRANQGQEKWSRTPFCCASSLWKLYGYPPPSTDRGGVLCDAELYLSAPLRAK